MKYFKVVDPKGHNGMFYKEGYNEDFLPFNPSGNCEKGGLYFSSRDIFAFYDYGTLVYEVEPVGEVYEEQGYLKKYKAHALNMKLLGDKWDLNVIEYLIENGADIHIEDDFALRHAAENGQLKIVKYFIKNEADIHAHNDFALRHAAHNGHLEVVKYLLEKGANIHVYDDFALRNAAENGHLEIVKYLVENGADIHVYNDYALRLATRNGHLEVVKYLLSKMDNI